MTCRFNVDVRRTYKPLAPHIWTILCPMDLRAATLFTDVNSKTRHTVCSNGRLSAPAWLFNRVNEAMPVAAISGECTAGCD